MSSSSSSSSTPTSSSYRIGTRATAANNRAVTPEASVLRSLFDLRKSRGADTTHNSNNNNNNSSDSNSNSNSNDTLTFRNCRWSPRVLASLRKLLARDRRKFSVIRFVDCSIEESPESSAMFSEVLTTILENNATKSLVVKGGRLIGSYYDSNDNYNDNHNHSDNDNEERHVRTTCGSFSRSPAMSNPFIVAALEKGLSANTGLESLRLSGLRFANNDNDETSWFESLASNTTLRSLDLSDTKLSSPCATTVRALSGALSRNKGLRSLSFRGSSLDDASMGLLIDSLGDHPVLSHWNLSGNRLGVAAGSSGSGGSSTLALDALSGLLRSRGSRLRSLDLSHQNRAPVARVVAAAGERDREPPPPSSEESFRSSLRAALGALSSNTVLSSIDLSGNRGLFSDLPTTTAVSDCLAANRGLRHADLSSCGTTTEGIASLARDCLPRCGSNLKSLVLFADGDEQQQQQQQQHNGDHRSIVAKALEEGLQSNATLESLGESVPCKHIRHVLDTNKGGRRAFLKPRDDPRSLPRAAWSHVLARANTVDYDDATASTKTTTTATTTATSASVVFELLRQGPVFWEH